MTFVHTYFYIKIFFLHGRAKDLSAPCKLEVVVVVTVVVVVILVVVVVLVN